ncbi:MAG: thioredoxin domain-containing protein [Acidobacteriota bacterium]
MARSILLSLVLLVVALPLAAADGPAEPEIVAVKFHADWCGSCKKMGSLFEDLTNKYDGKSVLFVTLDLTNGTTRAQAEYLAAALGFGEAFAAHPGTGFVLLLDGETRKPLVKLTADQNIKQMGAELLRQLESS